MDRTAGSTALPVSLENLLMERIGRLADGPRHVLDAAAVVGRRFAVDVVRRVCRVDGELASWLGELERQDLVFREPDGDEMTFKHTLVRDAVYQSLLKARREELHERVAAVLEDLSAGRLAEATDAIADHYAQTRRAEKAVRYLALAGARSLALYSLGAAEARFRQTRDLLRAVPGCADEAFLADVLLQIARVHYFRCDFRSVIALVEEYLPRVEALGDTPRLARFLFEIGYEESIGYASMGLMWFHIHWAPHEPARQATVERLGRRAIEIAERLRDVWLRSKVLLALAIDAGIWGRLAEAERRSHRLLELSAATGDPRPKAMGLWATPTQRSSTPRRASGAR